MPWLQIKAWGEKAQWKPGRVTHILHYIVASSPAARCLLPPCRKHRNFTRSASASCQLWGSRCARCPAFPCRCQPFFSPTLWWEMSAPLAVEHAHVQILCLWKWYLCCGLSCHDTSGDTEGRCLSALGSDKRGGGQKSHAGLKVFPHFRTAPRLLPLLLFFLPSFFAQLASSNLRWSSREESIYHCEL